jgi:hypothetical protein
MVGVSIPGNAVGGADAGAGGGVFGMLQKASFDPRITENQTTGTTVSAVGHFARPC